MSELQTISATQTSPKMTNQKPTNTHEFAINFITRNRSGALATVDSYSKPNVAIVYCVIHPDMSIYFSTRVEGAKYFNLMQNPSVAMAFQNEKEVQMLQLSGLAERVEDIYKEQQILLELMQLRHVDPDWPPPPLKLFIRGSSEEIAIIKIKPTVMTYANFKTPKQGKYAPIFQKII